MNGKHNSCRAENVKYPINEVFQSLQGEGFFTGHPAIFVRLQGCPIGCPWCDTQHTWTVKKADVISVEQLQDKTSDAPTYTLMDSHELMQLFIKLGFQAKHIVITGGEPCLYDLLNLCQDLHAVGYQTQIETSGCMPICCPEQTWVTVSPKINMPGGYQVKPESLLRADEIKFPIARERDLQQFDELLRSVDIGTKPIYLQPISQGQRATDLAIKTCIERNWRLSLQTHKYLGIE